MKLPCAENDCGYHALHFKNIISSVVTGLVM